MKRPNNNDAFTHSMSTVYCMLSMVNFSNSQGRAAKIMGLMSAAPF
jgi:hypothetical protein